MDSIPGQSGMRPSKATWYPHIKLLLIQTKSMTITIRDVDSKENVRTMLHFAGFRAITPLMPDGVKYKYVARVQHREFVNFEEPVTESC